MLLQFTEFRSEKKPKDVAVALQPTEISPLQARIDPIKGVIDFSERLAN